MSPVRVSVELSDTEAAELAVWSDYFGRPQAELVAAALRDGLSMRRSEYEYEQNPPADPLSGVVDDDIAF